VFVECEGINPDQPLRQGDIVAAHPGTPLWVNPWKRFAVVLSADCDIAQGKTGPNLICVPVVSYSVYLADEWLPDEASYLLQLGKARLDKLLARLDAGITHRQIAAWTNDSATESLEERMLAALTTKAGSPNETTLKLINKLAAALKSVEELSARAELSQHESLKPLLTRLAHNGGIIAQERFNDVPPGKRLVQEALSALETRIDTWLIRELQGLDPEMADVPSFGYVVPLRSLNFVPLELVETDRKRWYDRQDAYVRVCRLKAIYKTDLVHQFANLFIRVGLEDSRIDEHRRMFVRCAESLFITEIAGG
jgi:hypothetical protein